MDKMTLMKLETALEQAYLSVRKLREVILTEWDVEENDKDDERLNYALDRLDELDSRLRTISRCHEVYITPPCNDCCND